MPPPPRSSRRDWLAWGDQEVERVPRPMEKLGDFAQSEQEARWTRWCRRPIEQRSLISPFFLCKLCHATIAIQSRSTR